MMRTKLFLLFLCIFSLPYGEGHGGAYAQSTRLWASYYGGTNSDFGTSVITDASGNVYLAGYTWSTTGIASGGFQNTYGGGVDTYLVKFDGAGNRLWATYYGGAGDEIGTSVTTDASGNVYLAGYTWSTTGIASGGFQNTYGGGQVDAYLVKFDGAGNRLWATYYGGAGGDLGYSVTTDASGNVYLAGHTSSTTGIASGGFQNVKNGLDDAFLVKFDGSGNRLWATYYGGISVERSCSVTTDASGNVYLAGHTLSTTGIASGGFQNLHGGGLNDVFLVKFDASGNRLWASYYGGAGDDLGYSVTTDASGNVYLGGCTSSTTGIASSGFQNIYGGVLDVFLVKFDPSGTRLWATYYGGSNIEHDPSVAVDAGGNVYMCTHTYSPGSSLAFNGFQNTMIGQENFCLIKFDGSGNRLCATYYGQTHEEAGAIAVDQSGSIYVSGYTPSTSGFASGGFQNMHNGGAHDAFLVKFSSCFSGLSATATSTNTLCKGQCNGSATAAAISGISPYTYLWNTIGQTTQTVTGLCPGTYTVTITDNAGATAIATVVVAEPPAFSDTCSCSHTINLTLPNAFSPNGDGENDLFCLPASHGWPAGQAGTEDCIKELKIIIYNRWGEKVYESTDSNFCWDGTYQSQKLNSAVFVYYIAVTLINGKEITKNGNLSLIK